MIKTIIYIFLILAILSGTFFFYRLDIFNLSILSLWIHDHPIAAPYIFTMIYALTTILLIPSSPLNFLAGALFGPFFGGFLSIVGATIGSVTAFCLAKTLPLHWVVKRKSYKQLEKILNYFENHPWKVLAFIRVNPIVPTGILNYLIGITRISIKPFTLTMLLFGSPPTITFSYIGHFFQNYTYGLEFSLLIKKVSLIFFMISISFMIIPAVMKKILYKTQG